MNPQDVHAVNRALNKMAKLYRAVKARKLAAIGLHPGQDVLLWMLAQEPAGMTVSELAGRLGVESPTATRTLIRLEKNDLFRREPVATDRRQVRVVITAKGRALIADIERVWAELAEAAFGVLPDATRTVVVGALEQANDRLRAFVDEDVLTEE